MFARSRIVLAAFAVFTAVASQPALALSETDIYGKWCGTGFSYMFTARSLLVEASGELRNYPVSRYETTDKEIMVYWKRGNEDLNTLFSEFRGNTMVQQPNTTGDMGPRRELRRC